MPSDDPVSTACKILTTFKHCRAAANRLQACRKKKLDTHSSLFSGFNSKQECKREESSFKICAKERMENVIIDIMQVAKLKCAHEVFAFQQCKAQMMSDEKCVMQDQRAMECASRYIIASMIANSKH